MERLPPRLVLCSMATAGRDAGDEVYLGAVHDLEILPDVGGETLQITPLALGKADVEGEGRFSGAGDAGDDDELIPGDGQGDILQIMLPGTGDTNDIAVARLARGQLQG